MSKKRMKMVVATLLAVMMLAGSSISVFAEQSNFDGYDDYIYYAGYLRAYYEQVASSFSAYTGDANDDVYTSMNGSGIYFDSKNYFEFPIYAEGWNSCYYSAIKPGAVKSAECSYYLYGGVIKTVSIYV